MKMNQGQKTLKDIMTRGIITISAQSSISEIADTLARNNISSAPIVTINGETMGIVSEMDVLKAMGKPEWMKYDAECILSLIHISEPTRLGMISYAVFCLKKK